MAPMLVLCGALPVGLLIAWGISVRHTVFRFGSILWMAAFLASLGLLTGAVRMAADGGPFSWSGFWQMLVAVPGQFAHLSVWAVLLLGGLMAVSNAELMRREGMRPTNMVGTFLGVILAGATVACYLLSRLADHLSENASAAVASVCRGVTLWFYLLLDYGECMICAIMIMGYVAARSRPRYDRDFIIIPGCSISRTGGLRPLLKGRTNRAVRYAWEQEIATGKRVRFVPSGGQGPDEVMSEGSAMELYLLSHGAETDEVFPERKSTDTAENIAYSKAVIESVDPNARVAFSTTNYHVLRCGMLARRAGLDAQGIAASTRWYFWPNGFSREVAAIIVLTKRFHAAAAAALGCLAVLGALLF